MSHISKFQLHKHNAERLLGILTEDAKLLHPFLQHCCSSLLIPENTQAQNHTRARQLPTIAQSCFC